MKSSATSLPDIPATFGDRPEGDYILCGGSGKSVLSKEQIRDAWRRAIRRHNDTTSSDAE